MQIKFFTIPIFGGEAQEEELNKFLRAHKVLQTKCELVQEGSGSAWCCAVKEPQLQRSKHGLPFLGYQVFPYHCRLSQRSKRRFIRKARLIEEKYQSGEWSPAYCQRRMLPLLAFTLHADTKEFRKNVF